LAEELPCFFLVLWHFRSSFVEAIRKFAQPPVRRKRRSTHMKEFLLLLDKDVRHSCYPHFKRPTVIAGLCIVLFNGLLFILHMYERNWFLAAVLGLGNASLIVLTAGLFSKVRRDILLPMYHERLLAKIKTEHEAAIRNFNSKLPDYGYRVGAMPRASRDTVDDLRVRVAEQRLPTELVPVAQRIGQTQAELAEAELDLADSTATARSETTT
jgi:hypothetical protein